MVSAVDAEINPTIQVGLFYGQNALPGANLENYTGSGYRLGYFDEDLHFVTLGHTPETQISMVKTQNVSLSNGNYVDGTGSVTVGCYHLQMPGSYPDFESAAAAAGGPQGAFPAWIEGAYFVRVGAYATKEAATAAQNTLGLSDASVTGTSSYGVTVVATKTADLCSSLTEAHPIRWGSSLDWMMRQKRSPGSKATAIMAPSGMSVRAGEI